MPLFAYIEDNPTWTQQVYCIWNDLLPVQQPEFVGWDQGDWVLALVQCTCHDDSVTIFGINDAGAKGVGSQKILRRYRWMSRVQRKWQSHTQPSYENGLCGLIKQAKGPKSKSLNAFKSVPVLSNACSDVIARADRSLLNGEVAIINPKSRGST
jgi:hypothetical protein